MKKMENYITFTKILILKKLFFFENYMTKVISKNYFNIFKFIFRMFFIF